MNWKWIGFGQKYTYKKVLTKNFENNTNYKILLRHAPEKKKVVLDIIKKLLNIYIN